MLNYKQNEGKKTVCAGEKIALTRHSGVKKLRPLLTTHRTHRLTSWWPVALMGVIAESAEKCSETKQCKWGNALGRHYEIPQFKWYPPSSKACSSNARLWSQPEKSMDGDALRARDTNRREIVAPHDLLCLLVSASVEKSPSPNSIAGPSIGPEKEQRLKLNQISPNTTRRTIHTLLVIHGRMYCGANTILAWRAPNFNLGRGTTRSKRVTKFWMTSRFTRWFKHWNKTAPWCLLHEEARAVY